ncbi:hypothetical protein [Lentzea kentuckyensis]|uniref:hypothetical protein n=1 Tax=Lentzea kentuckyensis TaxID=360086 RepID=UPI0013022A46|nr:hypothetical protein [Lentzea kentuckyensis]
MTSLLAPAAAASAMPGLLRLPCTVRRHPPGISPPDPWRREPWHRWLPWWWFR